MIFSIFVDIHALPYTPRTIQGSSYFNQRNIKLIGFRNNDSSELQNEFTKFLSNPTLRNSTQNDLLSTDIKIDRKSGIYRYSLVRHDSGLIGSAASNHSRSVGQKTVLNQPGLTKFLDQEHWISKIILHYDSQQRLWTAEKFGSIHAVYRGFSRAIKAASSIAPSLRA